MSKEKSGNLTIYKIRAIVNAVLLVGIFFGFIFDLFPTETESQRAGNNGILFVSVPILSMIVIFSIYKLLVERTK